VEPGLRSSICVAMARAVLIGMAKPSVLPDWPA
jgi:hypothetical protein